VKRKSGITPERRRREDATIPDFTENQVQIFSVAMFCFINSKKTNRERYILGHLKCVE
jgi:hypothetical protein